MKMDAPRRKIVSDAVDLLTTDYEEQEATVLPADQIVDINTDCIVHYHNHLPIRYASTSALIRLINDALSSRVRTINSNTCWKKSGNLFVCGYCGRKLQKSNGKDIYLYCMKSRYSEGEDCSHIHADIQVVQQAVLQAIKTMGRVLTNGAVIVKQKQQADVQAVERELVAILQKQQKIKSAKSALYESYRSSTITKEKFIEIQQRNAAEVEKLEQQAQAKSDMIDQMKRQQKDMELVKNELRTVDALQEYDPAIIGQIVEKVIVYEGNRIELVMKNQDSYEAVFALTEQISA